MILAALAPGRALAQSGTISADPSPCTIPQGKLRCSATLSWATSPQQPACVWALPSNQPFSCNQQGSGALEAPWIDATGTVFELRLGTEEDPGATLASVAVRGVCDGASVRHENGFCLAPNYGSDGVDIGVDYHSISADRPTDSFLTQYDGAVRETVRQQLSEMASQGIDVVSTRIYVTARPGAVPQQQGRSHFPLEGDEPTYLRRYMEDVRDAGLKLYLGFVWIEYWADYRQGSPASGLGWGGLDAQTYIASAKLTVRQVLDAALQPSRLYFGPEQEAAGWPVLERIYFDVEVKAAACAALAGPTECAAQDPNAASSESPSERPNVRWFLGGSGLWQWFWDEVRSEGIIPSLYFWHTTDEERIHEATYNGDVFPEMNGHRSMFWIYRGLRFLRDNNLPIPSRVDFSSYPEPHATNFATLVDRVFRDYEDVIPDLLSLPSKDFFVAETWNLGDPEMEMQLQKGYASQFALHPSFRGATVWTTPFDDPYGEAYGEEVGVPADLSGFSDADIIGFALPNAGFEQAGGCSDGDLLENPLGYCTEWVNGDLVSTELPSPEMPAGQEGWQVGQDLQAGIGATSGLVLHQEGCALGPCTETAEFPGVFVTSDGITGSFEGDWALIRVHGRYDSGDRRGGAAIIDATHGGATISKVAFFGGDVFRDYLLLGRIPTGASTLKMRFQILLSDFFDKDGAFIPADGVSTVSVDDLE